MSYSEFLDWCKYKELWGAMHVGMRVDRAVARALAHQYSTRDKKFNLHDFSPYDKLSRDRQVLDSPEMFFDKLTQIIKE